MFLVVMTTTINPADPHLRRKLIIGLFKRGKFDRSKHEHMIEDFHCHLCDTDVYVSVCCGLSYKDHTHLSIERLRQNIARYVINVWRDSIITANG